MSFTPEEISTLRDLNYIARRDIRPPTEVINRLLTMSFALKDGTIKQWQDSDRSYLLGLMASTADGKYWRSLLDRLAAEIGVPIADVTTSTSSTPQPVPTPPAPQVPPPGFDIVAALAAYDIHIIPGKLAIGMQPDPNYNASIQLGGNVDAEILGVSNTKGTDPQNPGEVHKNVVSIAGNDGGLRLLQNLGWGPKGKIRTTLNRRASILALDSMGDLCKSTEEIGATSDGGQSWYIRTSGNVVEFCTYKVGAFIRILKSVAQYGATDSQQL